MLSYVSATGVLASSIFLLSLLWKGTIEGTGFNAKGTLFRWSGIPTSVSLYAFCYSAHPFIPSLHFQENKNQFSKVSMQCNLIWQFIVKHIKIQVILSFHDSNSFVLAGPICMFFSIHPCLYMQRWLF